MKELQTDILIVGGGLTGLMTAYTLSALKKEIIIIDKFDFELKKNNFDFRTTAISEGSKEFFNKAIDLEPDFADLYYHYGLLLVDLGDFEGAKNNFEKTTDIDQNYSRAYFQLAKLLIDPEDYEKAKKYYLIAIDIDASMSDAHYYLGKLLSGGLKNDKDGTLVIKPEYDNAIIHYKKAIRINKNYAKAHFNLALVYKIQKNYAESRKHFEKAIKLMNDYSKAHFHLAMLFKETDGKFGS